MTASKSDSTPELDEDVMRNLYRFGGLMAHTVMRHDRITHMNVEIETTFNEDRANALASAADGWVVQRVVHFRGAFSRRT